MIDSDFSFEEALQGIVIPEYIRNSLALIDVSYYSFDGKLHKGQLVIHRDLVDDIKLIFQSIKKNKFPISSVIPLVKYSWSDETSMEENNTSAFNYRKVKGSKKLSMHSYGKAIDINPFLNPQIIKGKVTPNGAVYNTEAPGTITSNSFLRMQFKKLGWTWGGAWRSSKDYQHFEKK